MDGSNVINSKIEQIQKNGILVLNLCKLFINLSFLIRNIDYTTPYFIAEE